MYVHTCLEHQTEFAIQSLATGSHEPLKSYAHSNGRHTFVGRHNTKMGRL